MSRTRWAWFLGVLLSCAAGAQAAVTLGPTGGRVAAAAGARALERGDLTEAIHSLERAAAQHPEGRTLYNLGTAYLAAGDPASAAASLQRGLTFESTPELRRRTLHNLARASLDQALAAPPGEALPSALESVVAGRDALRLKPAAAGTRRNLGLADELLARHRRRQPQPARDQGAITLSRASEVTGAEGGERTLSPREARAILDGIQSSEAQELQDIMRSLLGGTRLIIRPQRGPPW